MIYQKMNILDNNNIILINMLSMLDDHIFVGMKIGIVHAIQIDLNVFVNPENNSRFIKVYLDNGFSLHFNIDVFDNDACVKYSKNVIDAWIAFKPHLITSWHS